MFAKLTETQAGLFVLPVIRTVQNLASVRELNEDGQRVRMANLSLAERFSYGWADLIEENVDRRIYKRGQFTDELDGIEFAVTRTYPMKTFQDEASLKRIMREKISSAARGALQEPLEYDGGTYPLGHAEMTLYTLFLASGDAMGSIYDTDGVLKKLNVPQWGTFAGLLTDRMAAVVANKEAHNSALLLLSDAAAIAGYDFTTGW